MRVPIGTTGVSSSGGSVELIGRRGEGWSRLTAAEMSLDAAIRILGPHPVADTDLVSDLPSDSPDAPRFTPGEIILWQYRRHVEVARVVRDDARGLVVWIPSGSQRLESAPADGRRTRDVPLELRFRVPWVMREATWTGPGVLRVAPSGMPWSVWFFRRADGTPDGAYVNLELPHRRRAGDVGPRGITTSDLVLDLWIDAEHPGSEDVWLKDADELAAAVEQGRFTPAEAEAVRAVADAAGRGFIGSGSWPLDEGWESWTPDADSDTPLALPAGPHIAAARRRSGSGGETT
ncbi:MAG TPA: DUF402 domain-containing protein [Microbacterium sp.]|nr:DUF402 domain-containing protein [Microbacterium sp.]